MRCTLSAIFSQLPPGCGIAWKGPRLIFAPHRQTHKLTYSICLLNCPFFLTLVISHRTKWIPANIRH